MEINNDIEKSYSFASYAIWKNDIDELIRNVEMNPKIVHKEDRLDGTLLHAAARKGTPEMIEYLVEKGSDIDRIERSWSPLISAIVKNKIENVKKLIELGAKVDNKVSESNPLLYTMSENEENTEIAKLLIEAGADVTIQFKPRSNDWWDALSFAKFYGCKKIYKMILKKMKKDGIDYDSIPPMPEENKMENEEIVLPDIYEKYLGKIAKYYNESDLQKKIYDGKIRIISDLDDFDIAVIMPDENRDYITLATLGMSSIAMAETDEGEKFAELIMKLPSDFDVSEEGLTSMENNWPFRMMIKTAHLAHMYEGQYIDESVVIPSGNPNDAVLYFVEDSKLSSVMLCKSEDIKPLKVDDTMTIDFFTLIPITEGEGELVSKIGSEGLKEKLPKGEVTDLYRKYLG